MPWNHDDEVFFSGISAPKFGDVRTSCGAVNQAIINLAAGLAPPTGPNQSPEPSQSSGPNQSGGNDRSGE